MKRILITGGNRGIGFELVVQNLARGNEVWASYRKQGRSKELFALKNKFDSLNCFQMEATEEESVRQNFDNFKSANLKFDILFNNSGVIDWNDFKNTKGQSFTEVYEVNVKGAFLVMQNALGCLAKTSRVINLSSRLGSISLRGNTQLGGAIAYQCSKAALNMLTKQTSLELSDEGISVISISPGWVKTDMGGANAKYETKDSVRMMLEVIDSLEPEETGIFIGEDGKIIPW